MNKKEYEEALTKALTEAGFEVEYTEWFNYNGKPSFKASVIRNGISTQFSHLAQKKWVKEENIRIIVDQLKAYHG